VSAPVPRVGLGVILVRGGEVLLGQRKGSHGAGRWALPGGHLEFGESWEDCARREVLEETGLRVGALRFVGATNDLMQDEGKHYITLFLRADDFSGEPEAKEPNKCERWEWHPWDALPEPRFLPLENLLRSGYRL
jgi:8-oxo-dGTP diphosphatase